MFRLSALAPHRKSRLATANDPPPVVSDSMVSRGPDTKVVKSELVDGVWTLGVPLPSPINTPGGREHCPMLSRDQKTLCFASLRAGGYGKSDIYCSDLLPDGTFSEPTNAGPNINTAEDEFHFSYDSVGEYVYFSSAGHTEDNLGSMDIFRSKVGGDGSHGPAENLGPNGNTALPDLCPVFSPFDGDMYFFSFVSGMSTMFVSSNRFTDFVEAASTRAA